MQEGGRRGRREPIVWVASFLLVLAMGVGIGWWMAPDVGLQVSLASAKCEEFEKVDLSIDEIVNLKGRWKKYLYDDTGEAVLRLSGREASWLLSAESEVHVWMKAANDRIDAKIAAPTSEGCYNVHYQGKLNVVDGTAVLDADSLIVGGVEMSELMGSGLMRAMRVVTPEDLRDNEALADKLEGVQLLRVRGDELHVRFSNPHEVWR
jgi:hypothetical protein